MTVRVALLAMVLMAPVTAQAAEAGHTGGRLVCEDGRAAGFHCERVDLLAWLPNDEIGGGELNDIWGWTDPMTGREYAIVGRVEGTSFVDITDPEAPVYLGELPAHENLTGAKAMSSGTTTCSRQRLHDDGGDGGDGCAGGSTWRDVKVAGDHAYVVSESADHGLQVFDLRTLRGAAGVQRFAESAHYDGFGSAHNLAVDVESAYLYALGSDTYEGGLHILDVSSPGAPVFVAGFDGDGYTHDAQCLVYQGPDAGMTGRQVCFAANEDSLTILDVEDKDDIRISARVDYQDRGYAHQVWLSEDHRHLFLDDELDERGGAPRTRTLIFDVSDLSAPRHVATYHADTASVDHNHYVVGRHLFQSHYTSGLRVLDVSRPTHPLEVGRFDTHPEDDDTSFRGSWSNYPFFDSGTIAVSDVGAGLFLLRAWMHPDPGASVDLSLRLDGATPAVVEGETVRRDLSLSDAGDGASTVTLQVVHGEGLRLSAPAHCERGDRASVCRFDGLSPGESLPLVLSFTAEAAGDQEVEYRLASSGAETDPRDNSRTETFRVTSADDPEPPAGDDGGASSGGGGSSGLWSLSLLLACARRRRRVSPRRC